MGIRRGLSSRHLPCGCRVGIYETYGGEIVTILDVPQAECRDPAHAIGNVLPADPGPGSEPGGDDVRSTPLRRPSGPDRQD